MKTKIYEKDCYVFLEYDCMFEKVRKTLRFHSSGGHLCHADGSYAQDRKGYYIRVVENLEKAVRDYYKQIRYREKLYGFHF